MPARVRSRRWSWPTGPTMPRWKRSPPRSMWSPSISRTCRPRRRTGWPNACVGIPRPACAGGGAGSAGRENLVPRMRLADAGIRGCRYARRSGSRARRPSVRRRSSRRVASATTARASSASSSCPMPMPHGQRWVRRHRARSDPGSVRAVRARIVGARGARRAMAIFASGR